MSIAQIIGLIVVVLLSALCLFFIFKNSKEHTAAKLLLLFLGFTLALTWIFVGGGFSGSQYYEAEMSQFGLSDLPNAMYYAIGFASDKIIFLLALGAFYGAISRSKGYKKLVKNIANLFEGKEYIFILIVSLLFAVMESLLTQNFIPLIFVPFVVSIILSMGLDKVTAFAVTFGSILVGILGSTYGGEGLYWFNTYVASEITLGMIPRLIVLVVGYVLFNLFVILHVKKLDKKVNEIESDPFKVEKVEKDAKAWPTALMFIVIFILSILGYISWSEQFGIEAFTNFHNWLVGLEINGFYVFKVILGSLSAALGTWNLFHASILLIVFSILVALINRVKINDFLAGYKEGLQVFTMPIILYLVIYVIMIVDYFSAFLPTIINIIFKHFSTFNPFLVTCGALFSNFFHVDFGLTGLMVGSYFTTLYAENVSVVHTIFTTMYGFINFFAPTSGILLIGLSYLDIDYKTWIKYIWKFLISIFVFLLVLIVVITYI